MPLGICAGSPPAGITSGDGIAPPPLPLAGTGTAGGVVAPEKTGRPPAPEGGARSPPAGRQWDPKQLR